MSRLPLRQVIKECESKGFTVIGDYQGVVAELLCECPHGHTIITSLQNIRRNAYCPECDPRRSTKPLDIEHVQSLFSGNGLTLLETIYVNSKTKMKCLCECGNTIYKTVGQVRLGQKCVTCGYANRKERTFTYAQVKEFFEANGCVLLSPEYRNAVEYLDFICDCGKEGKVQYTHFRNGRRCKPCGYGRYSGARHYNYNANLTDEDRVKKRDYRAIKDWSLRIKERDRFTCVVCLDNKGGNLVSKHLYSYSDNPELRHEDSNGVTLCTTCHKEFHGEFGYGNNTKDEFNEFAVAKGSVDIEF